MRHALGNGAVIGLVTSAAVRLKVGSWHVAVAIAEALTGRGSVDRDGVAIARRLTDRPPTAPW